MGNMKSTNTNVKDRHSAVGNVSVREGTGRGRSVALGVGLPASLRTKARAYGTFLAYRTKTAAGNPARENADGRFKAASLVAAWN